ncbi:hypothetical protein THRCLA_09408 [Thraustotheca clavata]|uniref:START domain-containing protein n=1 Tax=Thraustotheca clavata TaxID=74557 RepID=A0A1V9YWW1_9STRA|nr:hypothetical protein THRCLA_09408 [Thraustotheca clavata]
MQRVLPATSTTSTVDKERTLEYIAIGDQSILECLAKDDGTDKSTTWSFAKESDGVVAYRGINEHSPWNCIKAITTVNCSAEELAKQLNDPNQMSNFDEMTDNCRVIEQLNPTGTTSIRYVQAKPVFPTTARDFLVVTSEHRMKDAIIIGTKSIQHDAIPLNHSFVRANTHVSGYIMRPLSPTKCQLTLIVHMDLGGFMPPYVINLLSVSSPIALLKRIRYLYGTHEGQN